MILSKCNLVFKNYSELGPKVNITEIIINRPLNYYFRGFYLSTRILSGLLCIRLKIGLS